MQKQRTNNYRPFVSFDGEPKTEEQRVELYNYLIVTGLSDSEARGTAWPS